MRGTNHIRAIISDLLLQFSQRRRGKRLAGIGAVCSRLLAGIQNFGIRGNASLFKNFRPAERKPAIADNKAFGICAKLAPNRFHAEGAATGDQNGRFRIIS